jgi:hypothetical protein
MSAGAGIRSGKDLATGELFDVYVMVNDDRTLPCAL